MVSTDCAGGTWPEQDAIDSWLNKHGIEVSFTDRMELKNAVTSPRLRVQRELEQTKIRMLPWWRKDKLGWPITTFKDRPVASFMRIVLQNIRKVLH